MISALLLISTAQAADDFATWPPLAPDYRSIKIYDNHGRFVGRLLPEKRYWVTLDRIPLFLQQAVVAVEDARFYEHGGLDMRGIARALVKDVVKGGLVEGGSTITQQLIKNRYLTGEKTLDRKLKEGFMAVDFEKKYTKPQILEMYFNEIYFGNGAWGLAAAARLYFDKNPEELSNAECALLAGVPKNPGRYNPAGEPVPVQGRRDVVLKRMETLKLITPKQKEELRRQRVTVTPRGQAPYYINHIRSKLIDLYGPQIVEEGGLVVTAALDLDLQKLAEQTLRDGVTKISPKLQGALVSLDANTGDLLAAVGGVDFSQSSYNRALFAKRQPGSAIKPLIYANALDLCITADSIWDDTPVAYPQEGRKAWKPYNYGKKSFGSLSLRQALTHSNNVITVKLLNMIGIPEFVAFAERFGIHLIHQELALALGTDEVTPLELVQAYTPFANGGLSVEPRVILRIVDHRRNQVTEFEPVVTPILDPGTAYLTTTILKDVLSFGTARSLASFSRERPMAGKTGTTDDYRDAWFIGYTPQIITGVWVGYDQPQPGGKDFTGGGICAPIWERFMRPALAKTEVVDFLQPENVIVLTIDPETGLLANADCPETLDEFYLVGSEPTAPCPLHRGEPLPQLPALHLPDPMPFSEGLEVGPPLLPELLETGPPQPLVPPATETSPAESP